jgi:hypothetical protein
VTAPGNNDVLDVLTRALAPEPVDPPLGGIKTLRRSVLDQRVRLVQRTSWLVRLRRWSGWRVVLAPRPAMALAALIVFAAMSSALSTGMRMPAQMRTIVRTVGLPVDSAELADGRSRLDQLQHELARGDHGRIARAADRLRTRIAGLGTADRAALEPRCDELLARADAIHDASALEVPAAAAGSAGAPATVGSSRDAGGRGTASSATEREQGRRGAPSTTVLSNEGRHDSGPPATVASRLDQGGGSSTTVPSSGSRDDHAASSGGGSPTGSSPAAGSSGGGSSHGG